MSLRAAYALLRPTVSRRAQSAWIPLVCVLVVGLFLARAPLSLCLLAGLGFLGGLALLLRPVIGFYLLAFAIPFGSLRELTLGGATVGASELLVLATLAAWALRAVALRDVHVARSRLTWAIVLYLGTLLLSIVPAVDLKPALKEWLKWAEFLGVYLVVGGLTSEGERKGLVIALLLAATAEGLLGVYQFLWQVGPSGFVLFGRYMRAYGTFSQPNPFGGYMGLTLPLAYSLVITTWRSPFARATTEWRWALLVTALALVATGVTAAALVMSWSRGALAGAVGGALLVVLALGRRPWVAWALALLLAFAVLLGTGGAATTPGGLVGRLTGVTQYLGQDLNTIEITDETFSVVERLAHWVAGWRMFSLRPWLGVGTGQYATVYPLVAIPRWEDPLGHAHNYYLNVLAEGGLVGLAAYLALVGGALAVAWRRARTQAGWRQGAALGALGMLGHLLVHSLFDNLYVHEMYLLVALVIGLVVSLRAPSRGRGGA